ncbi:hypothetical protein [Amycolatopsis aidingensis]|uniref:hypothetical protein n=1 Tax=Amycolatopsis aidingensis TaxID=2842453 RepID=UPI001E6007E7|nr:hypothetical protein [Amycolatopsis aidingensis]
MSGSGGPALARRTRVLLEQALELYRDSARATTWLRRHLARLDDPLRLAVLGPQSCGKSTLVNALAGERVAPIEVAGWQPPAWYRAAPEARAVGYPRSAPPFELAVRRAEQEVWLDGEAAPGPVDRVELDWPNRALRELTLVDTPGLDRAEAAPVVEGVSTEADAVLFLLPNPAQADLGFLRATRQHPIARAAPVHALAVLSRADELGGGRVDALISARKVARRHRREGETGLLCQDVVAVAGLPAAAGRTLREPEFAALAELARVPKAELEPYLLSADRLAGPEFPAPVDAGTRAGLLERFGLFGVRLASTLLRREAGSQAELAARLVARSGLDELRESVGRYLTGRRPVLKARAALIALEVVLRMEPRPGSAALAAELERVVAGAHEFRELRALAELRGGRVTLPDELRDDALRLLGDEGQAPAERLGMADAEAAEDGVLRQAAAVALRRWQQHAENPALGAAARRTAHTLVRTCEGLL